MPSGEQVAMKTGLSRRESNKIDKLRRIREAALDLFLTKGYDDATTREIAAQAEVGLGTVFVYAKTKRDLLFLIVNDDLDATVTAVTKAVSPQRSILSNLLMIARAHCELMGSQPELWRLALREMYFYADGAQAERFLQTRERLIRLFADVFAQNAKAIASKEDAEVAGWMAFALFQIENRRFLMHKKPDIDGAVAELRRQYRVLIRGALSKSA
jgi:AcrR family transcriptional regulator